MATLYFNAAVDTDWATLGNWWTDDAFTTQATSLPTSADDVIASAIIAANSGSEPTVANFTLNGFSHLGIAITVTGNATFNDSSVNRTTVTGNATFNGSSYNYYGKTVTGNATFNDYSSSEGTVSGDATFNDYSYNYGEVGGNATFNDSSYNRTTVTGNATFSLSSAAAQISGGFYGTYGSISFAYEKGINGSSILGVI
jgi:hypothetical protein